ncbi:hypothetical protein D3C81_1945320 [compost metagenome]
MAWGVCATPAAALQVGAQLASVLSRSQALRQDAKPASRSLSVTAGSASQLALS